VVEAAAPPKRLLGGTLLIARCSLLTGTVIVLHQSVMELINGVGRRFPALLYYGRVLRCGRASRRSGHFDHGVVLAPPRMFLVARGQNKSMQVAIGEHALSGNVPPSLMLSATVNCTPEPKGTKVLRSINLPRSHRSACALFPERPMRHRSCPLELMCKCRSKNRPHYAA
jgi:hypothetical protein